MGLFGGGGGGSDGGASAAAVKEGTDKGLAELQKYYKDALPALQQGANSAQGYLGGYAQAGSTALDELYDTLGLARPKIGTAALSAALQNQATLEAKSKTPVTSSTAIPGAINAPDFTPSDREHNNKSMTADGKYIFDHRTGQLVNTQEVRHDPAMGYTATIDPSSIGYRINSNGSGGYQLEKLPTTTTATQTQNLLSADEQKQLDIANQYKNGTLENSTASSSSILAKLQATPGYQFLMNQGLQSIDRSAAAQGLLGSGAALKGAQEYGSGLAEQTYNTRVSQLAQQAGLGAQLAGQQASYSAGLGTGLANLASNQGSNIASLYGAQGNNLASINAGQAAADAQSSSSGLGLLSSVAGGLFSMFSDIRVKKNVTPVAVMDNGLPIYEYNYIWDDKDTPVRIGVMAQDVLQVIPEAVHVDPVTGYYKVDYSKVVK